MTEILLKNNTITHDPKLDRVYQLDWRSLNYDIADRLQPHTVEASSYSIHEGLKPVAEVPYSMDWEINQWLDQGQEGACVGFSFSHELLAVPKPVTGVTDIWARNLYFDAQKIDPWPGGAYTGAKPFYEGTSVLAGAQVLKNRGFYSRYDWALNIEDLVHGLITYGPCVLGIDWYEGMYNTDRNGFIAPKGRIVGGHAIMVASAHIKYKRISKTRWLSYGFGDMDKAKSYVILHNSWGKDWGVNGQAKISVADLEKLLMDNGEACFPTRTDKVATLT